MKKNSFLSGAVISIIGIVICKVIGLVYVIPFYAIIGTLGGALYSYAYSIYNLFLNLATSGIPVAMSKVISEYNAKEYYNTKERTFKIGLRIISILCIISFLALMIFAKDIAYLIIGDVKGGNSIEDVAYVIRIISTAILVVPFLSVSKGYLQGHKIMHVSAVSDILEQLVRVIVILLGSYLTLKVFHKPLRSAVGISVFAATIGALSAYFYVYDKIRKNRELLNRDAKPTIKEKKITDKDIIKKIVVYALPFVIISLLEAAFTMVDVFTVVKTLVKLGYTAKISENVISVLSTWGSKLNMIVMSISTGIVTSLIPAISSAYAIKNYKEVNSKITQALQSLCLVAVPLSCALSFFSYDVWTVFYGYSALNISIFRLLILSQIPLCICSTVENASLSINNRKETITALAISFLTKCFLNIPFMHLFNHLGIEAYFGTIVLNILIDSTCAIILMIKIKQKTNIDYSKFIKTLIKIVLCTVIMLLALRIIGMFIPMISKNRLLALLQLLFYAVVGVIIYFYMAFKSKTMDDILGKNSFNKLSNKIKNKLKKNK